MKLATPKPEVAPAPAVTTDKPKDELDFGSEMPSEEPSAPSNDLPFEKEPFDAGVEADEDTDPKKFIQQLSGKLGESLRKYSEEQGQPDFELEKFAVNSVISATHTGMMDKDDMNDIIKKVKNSGKDDSQNSDMGAKNDTDSGDNTNDGTNDSDSGDGGFGSEDDTEGLDEYTIYENELFILDKGKRMSIFAPEGSDEFMEVNRIVEESEGLWANIAKKKAEGRPAAKPGDEDYPDKKQWDKLTKENIEEGESLNYMFWQNLKTIHHASGELLEMNQDEIDQLCANGHAWAVDHIATSSDDIEEVYHFFEANINDYDGETEGGYEDEHGSVENVNLNEAKYQGKKVKLGKPSKGDVKKFKVYVKNKKGNVVKVNFGDPKMEIKRDNPKNRKSFRARHKCSQAKDRTTPKYWSCKMWSTKPVSKIVGENLIEGENSSNLDKNLIKNMLQETFIPETKPVVKPTETKPTRKASPYTFEPDTVPEIDPKALIDKKDK